MINQDLADYLASQGYTGQLNDALYAFLRDEGYTGHLNEMLYEWLGDLGYTGALAERWYYWLKDGMPEPVDPVVPLEPISPSDTVVYFDGTDVPEGVVGSFTARGSRALPITVAGTGNDIVASADGLTFDAAKYLQSANSTTPVYERFMVLVDVTVTAASGTLTQVNGVAATRMAMPINSNGDILGQGPNNAAAAVGGRVAEIGERRVVAFIYDRTGLSTGGPRMATIGADGFIIYSTVADPGVDGAINGFRVGLGTKITVHRYALFGQATGVDFPDTISNLWQRFADKRLPTFSNQYEVWATTGHSLNAARTTEANLANSTWTRQSREGVKQMSGLVNTVGQPIGIEGPGWGILNEEVPATGLAPAEVNGAVTNVYAAAVARVKTASANGDTPPRSLVFSSAGAGAEAGQLSTGTIYDNAEYLVAQAKAQVASPARVIYGVSIGTSDRADAEGVYQAELTTGLNAHRDLFSTAWPSTPRIEFIYQSPGNKNTTADPWERITMAEYDLAIERNSLLIPLYPYAADGQNDHPHAVAGTLYGEVLAWAVEERLAGRPWTIGKPTVSREGGTITLTYALAPGESFVARPSSVYANPPANLGFEVMGGGTITEVALSSNRIILSTTGTVTGVRYANQRQNVVGQAHYGFRGLVRTSAQRESTRFPGTMLYKHLPSIYLGAL